MQKSYDKYVLIHGLGQTNISWKEVSDQLSVNVECPNLIDFMTQVSYYDGLYNEFSKWCDTFDTPLNLCGLSLGGILALDYASHFPHRVKSLVLIGTPYEIPKVMFGIQNIIFYLMPSKSFEGMGISKKNVIALTNSMKNLDIPKMTENISCKALILCGEKDRANYKSGKMLCASIADSSFKAIKSASHEVNIDNPNELAEILSGFWK